jgi:hypothetical protein
MRFTPVIVLILIIDVIGSVVNVAEDLPLPQQLQLLLPLETDEAAMQAGAAVVAVVVAPEQLPRRSRWTSRDRTETR